MIQTRAKAFSFVCLAGLLFSGMTHGYEAGSSSGRIQFVGKIVEDPCTISTKARGIIMDCYRNGTIKTSSITFQNLTAAQPWEHEVAKISMRYINPEKSLAVLRVEYK